MSSSSADDNSETGDAESEFLHADTSRVIIGASYALHNELGCGFLEAVYSNGLAVLLRNAGLNVDREAQFKIEFHGRIGYQWGGIMCSAEAIPGVFQKCE